MSQTTYVKDDPLYHTFFPHTGENPRAFERQWLMARRNGVEGSYAELKLRGKALTGSAKPQWMDEICEAEWLIGGTFFAQTLSRLVSKNGEYRSAYNEMEELGLIESSDETS